MKHLKASSGEQTIGSPLILNDVIYKYVEYWLIYKNSLISL